MGSGKPFIPQHERERRGYYRLPHHRLIDQDDPLVINVFGMLKEMELAGVEIDARAAEIATKLVHWKFKRRQETEKARLAELEELAQQRLRDEEAVERWRTSPGIVYYILRNNLIKIGTTVRPKQRFDDLMPDAVLATEPGNEELERVRHKQFHSIRYDLSCEYFHPDPALINHIRQLRAKHGVPDGVFRSLVSREESAALVKELLDG